jgi:MHS family proline/betaine transporter-like MFS transporter
MVTLMKSMAIFGAAFIMRPIGGIIMGWIGDTFGRRRALEISILLMLFPSFLIGCLPTYSSFGWVSSFLLVILRLMQGLAAGGELVGAFLYTLESAEEGTKGFWGGACKATGNFGTTLGLGLVTLLRYSLTSDQMKSWGWRIPFWFGLLFGIGGVIARSRLREESIDQGEEYEAFQESTGTPIKSVCEKHSKDIWIVVFAVAFWGCCYYTIFIWMVYFMQDSEMIGGNGVPGAWIINLLCNFSLVLLLPLGGKLGDVLGRLLNDNELGYIQALKIAIGILVGVVIPGFLLIITRHPALACLGQAFLVIPVAIYGGNLPIFMISRFETALRFTGVGIGKNSV